MLKANDSFVVACLAGFGCRKGTMKTKKLVL